MTWDTLVDETVRRLMNGWILKYFPSRFTPNKSRVYITRPVPGRRWPIEHVPMPLFRAIQECGAIKEAGNDGTIVLYRAA